MADICFIARRIVDVSHYPSIHFIDSDTPTDIVLGFKMTKLKLIPGPIMLCTVPGCTKPRDKKTDLCENHADYKCSAEKCEWKPLPGLPVCVRHMMIRKCQTCQQHGTSPCMDALHGSTFCKIHFQHEPNDVKKHCYYPGCHHRTVPDSIAERVSLCATCFQKLCQISLTDYSMVCSKILI